MNIKFNNMESIVVEFELSESVSVRINESKDTITFKLRNSKYETDGVMFKIKDISTINNIQFGTEKYDNLNYKSNETYIHYINSDENINNKIVEDYSVTFEKVAE